MTTLIISNEETDDLMKIVKSLKESGLLKKRVGETIKNEAKEQKDEFLGMLLGTLHASLLWNLLPGKGVKQPNSSNVPYQEVLRANESTIRAG